MIATFLGFPVRVKKNNNPKVCFLLRWMAFQWKGRRTQKWWLPLKSAGMWLVCWWWTRTRTPSSRGAEWPPPRTTSPVRGRSEWLQTGHKLVSPPDPIKSLSQFLSSFNCLFLGLPLLRMAPISFVSPSSSAKKSRQRHRDASCPPPHVYARWRKLIFKTGIDPIRQISLTE